jgi:multicomponent Na+:H+ antiporter subunit A
MGLTLAVLAPFLAALAAPRVVRAARGAAGWVLAALPLGLTVYFARLAAPVVAGETLRESIPWMPSLGVHFSFYLDGLSLLFALLIAGIGLFVALYAGSYLAGHAHLGRFYVSLLLFMGSMFGLVLADNVVTLFVFWELTSLASYLLIGFDHHRDEARRAALQALLVTGLGGLALLAGLLLLGLVGGGMELSALLNQGAVVREHPLYLPILLLVLVGAFTKSAQFPFHFWLPSAMEAPTPVSAYLHSATMVKAGVYLLARLAPVLGRTETWHYLVTSAGAVTMLLGAFLALTRNDLKQILAYTTVSSLGTLVLLIGLDTTPSIQAAVVFLLVHALYKGALFLIAGAIDHETGVRDLTLLGGLRRAMPVTAAAATLAALSMAGLPPMLGFIGKELLYEAKLQAPRLAPLIAGAGVLANVLLAALAGFLGVLPFFGARKETPRRPHEAPLAMWLGPAVLGGLGLVIGLFPETVATPLVSSGVAAGRAEATQIKLALWHGLNPVLLLSVLTIAGGAGVFLARGSVRAACAAAEPALRWGPAAWYDWALNGVNALARRQTRLLQSGYLRYYLLTIMGATVGLAGATLVRRTGWPDLAGWRDVRFYEFALAALILAAAVVAVRSYSRLAAIASLGVVGYGVALIYILFGAPDLAMTQFLVETLTVILFVFVFYHLPRFASLSSPGARARDVVVALAAGGLMTLLVLAALSAPMVPHVSTFFAENAVPRAHGRNIVNVILVDFRALDTLGEITVLAVAGVGVYALLKLRPEKGEGR